MSKKNKHKGQSSVRQNDQQKKPAAAGSGGQSHSVSSTPSTTALKPESRDFSQMPAQQKSAPPASLSKAPPRPTLEQQRAAHALDKVNGVKSERLAGDYKSYCESLSATIVMNGLGQACATLLAQAKGKTGDDDAHRRLFDDLEDWLCGKQARVGLSKPLIDSLVKSDQTIYCHAQAEALAYLVWLKKFAQAFLSKADKPEKGGRE
ncbi:MAG: type III-B CRISPR module-associated protein Cmr5 [Planctomycetia bacterium]|nr:type III-B CRISPR module-associated protein Cmr5 [Planctomycetia bacterium]